MSELVGLGLDALDDVGRVELGFVLDPADQLLLGLLGGEAGDLLEPVALLVDETLQLVLAIFELFLAVAEATVALLDLVGSGLDLLGLLVEVLFLLLSRRSEFFISSRRCCAWRSNSDRNWRNFSFPSRSASLTRASADFFGVVDDPLAERRASSSCACARALNDAPRHERRTTPATGAATTALK